MLFSVNESVPTERWRYLMRVVSVLVGAATATVMAGLGVAAPAHASNYGIELNGQYLVTSNGDWAKSNEVFHNERTIRQVWTTSSSCASPSKCTGQLTSSEGWTAPMRYSEDQWIVDRFIPDWQPCYDGSASGNNQKFRFWPVDSNGQRGNTDGSTFGGFVENHGLSGACGKNLPLVITVPLRVQRIIQ